MRSPMVMRNVLSATAGSRRTRKMASSTAMPSRTNGLLATGARFTSRVILGGLPSSTDSGMSMGWLEKWESLTLNVPSSVALPRTAKGQRSRRQSASKAANFSAAMAST